MKTTKWYLDAAHSEIQFKVKHLMITTVTGYFRSFSLVVETETDDFATTRKVEFTADVNSIDTNNEQRDTHLKSVDFFDSDTYGLLKYKSNSIDMSGEVAILSGELTMRGVTRPIQVLVEFAGLVIDPYGQTKAGFSIKAELSRKQFGLMWDAVTETGNVVVSDEIRVHGEIQLIKQAVVAEVQSIAV